jgi:hypothetical protein
MKRGSTLLIVHLERFSQIGSISLLAAKMTYHTVIQGLVLRYLFYH